MNDSLRRLSVSLFSFILLIGCSSPSTNNESTSASASNASASNVSLNKDDYPVFPDAGAGADPAVSAEQGGKGFTGEGWQTNTNFDLPGDPRAVKGGLLRDFMADFPGTLRMWGPEANTTINYWVLTSVYETLLSTDPRTLDYVPSLATHWQISPDKATYRYRINPNARFSNGEPVTSDDVVKSWEFFTDKGLQDLPIASLLGRFEKPVAESKYIVRVKSKQPQWRSFLDFSGMVILPASVLKNVDGATYLKENNFKLLPGSGPYLLKEPDIEKGKSLTVTRRNDYWGEKARANVGLYNFEQVRFTVVRDENLAFEMFKKGDLDFFYVHRAKQWSEDLNFDNIQRGVIEKVKVYNNEPQGTYGLAFNMRREPFNDVRVRKALALLLDRKKLIEKIMFNQYQPMTSYFANTVYENKNNPKYEYNPEEAVKLLAEAGWNSRDNQGRLVKNGKPLQLELLYVGQTFEPHLTVYQEDLRKVGITMNLRLVTGETQFSLLMNRSFDVALNAWSVPLFPNPEDEWGSKFADEQNTPNINGFKDKRVDDLIDRYNNEFDINKRVQLLQEMDGIVASQSPYALFWQSGFKWLVFWNKFGFPPGYISRTGDYLGSGNGPGVPQLWWYDAQKAAALNDAMRDTSKKLPILPLEDRYWLDFGKSEDLLKAEPTKTQ